MPFLKNEHFQCMIKSGIKKKLDIAKIINKSISI
jgi:hypothetical protein